LQNDNKEAVARFQVLYEGLTRAYLAKDTTGAGKYLAPDYSSGSFSNPLNRKKTLDQLRHWDGVFRTTSRTVLSVIVNGKMATAIVASVATGAMRDSAGNHVYVIKGRSMDTWEHNPAGWQLKHARVLQKAVTKDGKPLPGKLGGASG